MGAIPMKFRGRISLPWDLRGDHSFDDDKIAELCASSEGGRGGWYPLGANQMWHNGIHLGAPHKTEVRSIAPGRIIAARLADTYVRDEFAYGSHRFVLIKHEMSVLKDASEPDHDKWKARDVAFYSLYMHLNHVSGLSEEVPWLRGLLPFLNNSPSGDARAFAKVNVAKDTEGEKADKKTGLWCREEPTESASHRWVPGAPKELLPLGTVVERLDGKHGEWREVRVPQLGIESGWIYDHGNRLVDIPDFARQIDELSSGGCAKLDYPVESGEIIGHVGVIHPARFSRLDLGDQHGIHLEIFSKDNIVAPEDMGAWKLVEDDTDDDALCEVGELVSKVGDVADLQRLGWDSSRFATLGDAEMFYWSLSPADKAALRTWITRNTSFWSIDWGKMRRMNPEWVHQFDFGDEEQRLADRYMWWRDCEARHVDLPARVGGKALVHHYNPLAIMAYLAKHTPPLPIFFVKRGKSEHVVARPDDINIAGHEKVWVYEPPIADWMLGFGSALQGYEGIENPGTPSLYAMLIYPATTPGVPALDAASRNIWASLYMSEGGLDAVNSYDRAYLSFGPFQQTMGTIDSGKIQPGELEGALNAVRSAAPLLFDKYFGKFGLDVDEVKKVLRLDKGFCKIDGNKLETAAEMKVLRDFIWAYRGVKSIKDVELRTVFLRHGFGRLGVVRGLKADIGGEEVTVTDIYRTEAALALILDAHINAPAIVDRAKGAIWVTAAKAALNITGDSKIDPSAITQDNEYDMIKKLVELREEKGVVEANLRSAYILLCAKDLDDKLAKKFGYGSVEAMIDATHREGQPPLDVARAKKLHKLNFLGHAR